MVCPSPVPRWVSEGGRGREGCAAGGGATWRAFPRLPGGCAEGGDGVGGQKGLRTAGGSWQHRPNLLPPACAARDMLIAKTLVHGWPLLVSTTHLESPVTGDMFKVGGE